MKIQFFDSTWDVIAFWVGFLGFIYAVFKIVEGIRLWWRHRRQMRGTKWN